MILEINPKHPEPRKIKKVVEVLTHGGIIAYPTDTFYGIGCDLFNKEAIEKISASSSYGGNPMATWGFVLGLLSPVRAEYLESAIRITGLQDALTSLSYYAPASMFYAVYGTALLLFFYAVRAFLGSEETLRKALWVITLVGLFEAVYGLLQATNPGMGVLWLQLSPELSGGYARGTIIYRNQYASFLNLCWPMALALGMGAAQVAVSGIGPATTRFTAAALAAGRPGRARAALTAGLTAAVLLGGLFAAVAGLSSERWSARLGLSSGLAAAAAWLVLAQSAYLGLKAALYGLGLVRGYAAAELIGGVAFAAALAAVVRGSILRPPRSLHPACGIPQQGRVERGNGQQFQNMGGTISVEPEADGTENAVQDGRPGDDEHQDQGERRPQQRIPREIRPLPESQPDGGREDRGPQDDAGGGPRRCTELQGMPGWERTPTLAANRGCG